MTLSNILLLSSLVAVASTRTIRGGQAAATARNLRNRIIGGTTAQEDRYSFAVSLQDGIGHFCGGTLISPDVVVSAAHCAGGSYDVVVGRHHHSDRDGEEIGVAKEMKHPDYDEHTTNNDYMLLFLDRPVEGDVKFASITDNFVGVSEAVTVVGWGDIDIDSDVSTLADELQEIEVYTVSNQECDDSEGLVDGWEDNYHGQITSSMLCAEHPTEKDACQGDSGGPLVKKSGRGNNEEFELVGVVSWGVGCAHNDFPGIYARVSAEYDWIKKEVCKRSSHPPTNFGCSSGNVVQEDDYISPNGSDDSVPTFEPTLSPTFAPSSEPTISPTFAPTLSPSIESDSRSNVGSSGSGIWRTVVNENFSGGFGTFKSDGQGSKYYPSAKNRSGVARIQETSSISSIDLTLHNNESIVRVNFSAYVVVFEPNDEVCLDVSIDDSEYVQQRCWSLSDISNKEWINMSADFTASDSLSIRFRCNGDSKHDDVLIDEVQVQASS